MSKQVPIGGTDASADLGKNAAVATTAVAVGAAISQIIMNGALAQIWGMINGMQILMHFPTLNLSVPVTAQVIISKLLSVFTFDFPYVDWKLTGEKY